MKMQSYAAIKAANLSRAEIDGMFQELYHRGHLRDITKVDGSKVVKHTHWLGSMDDGAPCHPRSTSVKVSWFLAFNCSTASN